MKVDYVLEERPAVIIVRLRGSLDAYLRDFTPEIEKQIRTKPRHLVANLLYQVLPHVQGDYLVAVLRQTGRQAPPEPPDADDRESFHFGRSALSIRLPPSPSHIRTARHASRGAGR